LLFCTGKTTPDTSLDVWYATQNESGDGWDWKPFLRSEFTEYAPRFSPDGRYVAYQSNESGRPEVYVREFPDGTGRLQVSENGGASARWRRNGKELYYKEGNTLVAVPVSVDPVFSVDGPPVKLFRASSFGGYDVSADGQRFLVAEPVSSAGGPVIRVVQNWFEELRERQ
jgi:serine/threonine-protein kinase